jgi:hypothetical protein
MSHNSKTKYRYDKSFGKIYEPKKKNSPYELQKQQCEQEM